MKQKKGTQSFGIKCTSLFTTFIVFSRPDFRRKSHRQTNLRCNTINYRQLRINNSGEHSNNFNLLFSRDYCAILFNFDRGHDFDDYSPIQVIKYPKSLSGMFNSISTELGAAVCSPIQAFCFLFFPI